MQRHRSPREGQAVGCQEVLRRVQQLALRAKTDGCELDLLMFGPEYDNDTEKWCGERHAPKFSP